MEYPIILHPKFETERKNALKRKKAFESRVKRMELIDHSDFELVVSVEHLVQLAEERRSCYHCTWRRIVPAAVLINQIASFIHTQIKYGRIKVYPKKHRRLK